VTYEELRAELAPGDAVVLYSDGVVEARNGREEYGPERLCRGLEANASGFLGGESPHDDVTLIVIKVL